MSPATIGVSAATTLTMARSIRLCSRLTRRPPSLNDPDQIAMSPTGHRADRDLSSLGGDVVSQVLVDLDGGWPLDAPAESRHWQETQECQMPCNVKTRIDVVRRPQAFVCRDEPSRDRGRRRTIDSDLSERRSTVSAHVGSGCISRTT